MQFQNIPLSIQYAMRAGASMQNYNRYMERARSLKKDKADAETLGLWVGHARAARYSYRDWLKFAMIEYAKELQLAAIESRCEALAAVRRTKIPGDTRGIDHSLDFFRAALAELSSFSLLQKQAE